MKLTALFLALFLSIPFTSYAQQGMMGMFGGKSPVIYGKLPAEQKQAMKAEAAKEGLKVEFNSDGSTTFTDSDGSTVIQKPDGTMSVLAKDGKKGEIGSSWPDNKFTKMLPKPDFPVQMTSTEGNTFSVLFAGASVDQVRAYAAKVKQAGFSKSASTEDQAVMGMTIFAYSAQHANGAQVEIFHAPQGCGLTLTVK